MSDFSCIFIFMKNWLFGLAIISGLLFSCVHSPTIYNPPSVSVDTHDTVNFYMTGDTLRMDISISDDNGLNELFISCVAPDTGAAVGNQPDTMYTWKPNVDGKFTWSKDTFWVVNSIPTLLDCFVTVIATNHHDGLTEIDFPVLMFP